MKTIRLVISTDRKNPLTLIPDIVTIDGVHAVAEIIETKRYLYEDKEAHNDGSNKQRGQG